MEWRRAKSPSDFSGIRVTYVRVTLDRWSLACGGLDRPENAEDYEQFLLTELFPAMRNIQGFLGADVLWREDGEEVGFVTLTRFASIAAIRAFAGDDFEFR